MNLKQSDFFCSLPAHLKESIFQSGIDFSDESELREFVQHYEERSAES